MADLPVRWIKDSQSDTYYIVVADNPPQKYRLELLQSLDEVLENTRGYTKNQTNYLINQMIGQAFVWKQSWSSATTYALHEWVTHLGSIYIALSPNTNVEPGSNDLIWDLAVRGVPLNARVGLQLTADGTVSTGTGKAYMRVPIEFAGYLLTYVAISCIDPPSTDKLTITIYRGRQTSATSVRTWVEMLSTPVTIDIGHRDSRFASVPVVVNLSNAEMLEGDLLRFDVTVSGGATGPVGFSLTGISS